MDYTHENIETLSKEEIRDLSRKLYEKFCKVSEHLTSEKLLLSYYEKDESFARARAGCCVGPTAYCWDRTQERIQEFSEKIQSLKYRLNKIADVYDARFPEQKTRRSWET
jgi:hypothetical protein